MAYFCLTVLEWSVRDEPPEPRHQRRRFREKAAKEYGVDLAVLNEIGALSSEYGGVQARKADGVGKDLKPEERRFLDVATNRIIRRMAERAYNRNGDLPKIGLIELPPLPEDRGQI